MQKSFPRRAGVLALVLLLCLNLSGCGVFGLVFGLSGAAERTEVHEDPAEYETLLGPAAAPEGSFFGPELNQGIFPAALGPEMEPVGFRYVYHNDLDAAYLAYLTVDCTQAAYDAELDRLAALPRSNWAGVYSVTGFPGGAPLAVSAGESGLVYAVSTPERARSISYVLLEFCDRFLSLDPAEYIPAQLLPQGLDLSLDNPYAKKLQAEYAEYDRLRLSVLERCEALDPEGLPGLPEPLQSFYRADEFWMEWSCGGLLGWLTSPGAKALAPGLPEDLERIGAAEHRLLLETFLAENQIDLKALSGFVYGQEAALRARYDFARFDAALAALPPLWQLLRRYAQANPQVFP